MNYFLLHNLENNVKEQLIKNYINDGYEIIYKDHDDILMKNNKY